MNKEDIRGLTDSTLTGFFWMFSGTGLQAVLQGLVLIVLARLLTPADFGLVGAALVVVSFSELISQLGIGPAIVQRPSLKPRHLRTGFTISLLLGVLLAGSTSLIAPAIAGFFRMEELTLVLRIMSLIFPIQGVSVVAHALLQRELRFRWLAEIQVSAYALGYGVVGVCLSWMGFGVWALVAAHLAQVTLMSAILIIVRPHPMFPQFERCAFRELMYFGGGFTLARLGNYIALQGDRIVVGRWLGAEILGLYGRAYQLMVLPVTLFGQVLDRVLFPAMAKVQDDPERLTKAYRRVVALVALFILPTSAGMIVLAPELIHLLLGPAWKGTIDPFRILAIGMLFRTSYKISHSLARATGAVYPNAWRQAIYAAFVVGGAWIGKDWGISGVALGVLGAIIFNFILMAQLSLRLTTMTWSVLLAAHLPAIFLSVLVCADVWVVAMVMRNLALSPITILITSIVITGIVLLILLRFMARFFLGQDGIWMLETLGEYLPMKIVPFWLNKKEKPVPFVANDEKKTSVL